MLPREKALNIGINSLSNEELLALIIKSGYKNNDVFALSRALIDKADGFENLLSLNYEELIEIKGIKKAKALEILAILETAKRLSNCKVVKEECVNSPSNLLEWLRFNIGFSNQEEFLVVFLGSSGKILKSEILFKGTRNTSIVGVDEVMRKAILLKSSGIVVCHNHPSGRVDPSKADIEITNNLKNASEMLGLKFYDHIIVSKDGYYSFKQANLI